MVNVLLYNERLIATPAGSVMAAAQQVYDLYDNEAAYVVGMNDGKYMIDPPEWTSAPTLNKSSVIPGDTLTCTPGGYTGGEPIFFRYQWELGGVAIPGEITNSFWVRQGDVGGLIRCLVEAYNPVNFTRLWSDACSVSAITQEASKAKRK